MSLGNKTKEKQESSSINNRIMITLCRGDVEGITTEKDDIRGLLKELGGSVS